MLGESLSCVGIELAGRAGGVHDVKIVARTFMEKY
jgi:hypothetical protein